jgi:hypothetical protein
MISAAVRSDKANRRAHQRHNVEMERSAAMLRRNSQERPNMNVDELDGLTEDGPIADRTPVVDRP